MVKTLANSLKDGTIFHMGPKTQCHCDVLTSNIKCELIKTKRRYQDVKFWASNFSSTKPIYETPGGLFINLQNIPALW